MKRFLPVLTACAVLLFFSVSCGQTSSGLYPRNGRRVVRIVSYNVGVFDKWDGSGIGMTASLMKELAPDVIALQELDSCASRTGNIYQLQAFAADMGQNWDCTYSPALKPFQGGAYGVGETWNTDRLKAVDMFNLQLPQGKGSETRALVVVEYEDMVVAGTHLDHRNDSSQLAQAVLVTETLKNRYADTGKPVFLCGDFNAYPDSRTLEYCREHWDVLTLQKTTFPEWDEVSRMQDKPKTVEDTPGICMRVTDYIWHLKHTRSDTL